MNEELAQTIEESIKLELNAATLYKLFSSAFPEDSGFWGTLYLEEEEHASLIKAGRDTLLSCDEFPAELLAPSLQDLIEANNKLRYLINKYNDAPPSRKETFDVAVSLEESAGELHFQLAMDKPAGSILLKTFQNLNKNDKDHSVRIHSYKKSQGI